MASEKSSELKQTMLAKIKGLSKNGKAPGLDAFIKETGFSRWQIEQTWLRWEDAARDAGLEPNTFGTPEIPRDMLLSRLAELTRKIGRIPSKGNLQWAANNMENFPAHTTFFKSSLSNRHDIALGLAVWINTHTEYADLRDLILSFQQDNVRTIPEATELISEEAPELVLSENYLPPVVQCLPDLARATSAALRTCESSGLSLSVEFEHRTAVAFELLGFSVERLGQGSGRNPDGIAKCFDRHWAIIYDAKVRTSPYRLLTEEDRKFKEYIERVGDKLRDQGITKYYFAVVSSGFSERDLPKAKELVRQTQAKSCVLVDADALIKAVEQRIKSPGQMSMDDVERLFVDTKILRGKDLQRR